MINRYTIEETVDTGVDNGDLNFDRDRLAVKKHLEISFEPDQEEKEQTIDPESSKRTRLTIDLA